MQKLTKQDLHDILLGAAIVGTGGGGSLVSGLQVVNKALDDGLDFYLASPEEVKDDAMLGTPYGCGSISPFSEEQQKKYDAMEKIDVGQETAAMRALEKYYNTEFYGVIATELGGNNTAVALETAARLGKPILDADPAGRSVPCLQHTTYFLKDIPIAPMGVANEFGDELVITSAKSDERAEALVRAAAVASFNLIGVVDHPNTWSVLKDALHLNTITWCLEIGKVARVARDEGRTISKDIIENFDGYNIFDGIIKNCTWRDEDGFTYGDIYIDGKGEYEGQELRVWYQNENLMTWLNGEFHVMTPDPINIINCDENMPLLNPDAREGMNVSVFGFKAREEWRTEKGLDILGPGFFNFDVEYKKIEDILGK